MHKSECVLESETLKILWDFEIQMKSNRHLLDFAVSANHRMKINKTIVNEMNLDKELKKLWNMKVTFKAILVSDLRMGPKGDLRKLEIWGRNKTIQTTAQWKSARIILEDFWRPEAASCFTYSWEPLSKTCLKSSQRVLITTTKTTITTTTTTIIIIIRVYGDDPCNNNNCDDNTDD